VEGLPGLSHTEVDGTVSAPVGDKVDPSQGVQIVEYEDKMLDELTSLYCEIYAGDPWFQNFDKEEIRNTINGYSESDSDVRILIAKEGGKIEGFAFVYVGDKNGAINLFEEVYPSILTTESKVVNKVEQAQSVRHTEEVSKKLKEMIPDMGAVGYVLDLCVSDQKRSSNLSAKLSIDMIKGFSSCDFVFAQTLSVGPMKNLLGKVQKGECIDAYPEGETQHLTFEVGVPEVVKLGVILQRVLDRQS
jgi:hypothetical protein